MNQNILVSIIIPVFNGERYIENCVRTLGNQTNKNFEVLFVDDGSTDNTFNQIKCFRDERFHYFYQENSGVSAARNLGIKKANGDLLIFPDVDDFLDKEYVEKLVSCIDINRGVNFGFCGYNEVSTKGNCLFAYTPHKTFYNNKVQFVNEMLKHHGIGSTLWNKIFVSQIIRENSLTFDESITIGEDMVFIINYLEYVENILGVKDRLYNYVINPNGAMNKSTAAVKYDEKWNTEWLALLFTEKQTLRLFGYLPEEIKYKKFRVSSKLVYLAKKLDYSLPAKQRVQMKVVLRKDFFHFFVRSGDEIRMKLRVLKRLLLSM